MFLFGISWAGDSGDYAMTRVYRKMRDLRMTYTLEKAEVSALPDDAGALAKTLSGVYADRKYVIINPRFSQVGRPTVKVEMRPRLFISSACCGDHDLLDKVSVLLRKSLIPVDAVSLTDQESWTSDEGQGFGGDYSAPARDILEFLLKISKEGRLRFAEDHGMPGIEEAVSSGVMPDGGMIRAAIISLAVSVWFGEHKKQLKTHSAGGRVQI